MHEFSETTMTEGREENIEKKGEIKTSKPLYSLLSPELPTPVFLRRDVELPQLPADFFSLFPRLILAADMGVVGNWLSGDKYCALLTISKSLLSNDPRFSGTGLSSLSSVPLRALPCRRAPIIAAQVSTWPLLASSTQQHSSPAGHSVSPAACHSSRQASWLAQPHVKHGG